MDKSCLRQLEALINSFTFYPKRFLKKPLYKVLWPKIRFFSHPLFTEKNTGVYLKKTVVELTKIFIKTQPTTLVVELMNKIRKSHFVINLTNLFVNITKKIHYVNDAAFVDLTHLFVNPTKNFYKIFFLN